MVWDAEIESDVRLDMIRHATRTIDFVTYAQMPDNDVSQPFLSALREAANRGVHVRYLTNDFQNSMVDMLGRSRRYLLHPPTIAPIEVLYFGGLSTPFGLINYVHEKLLIIDGQVAITSGRPIGAENLRWLDKSFLFKGGLVSQANEIYERLWDFCRAFNAPRGWTPAPGGTQSPIHPYQQWVPGPRMQLDRDQQHEADELKSWLRRPSQDSQDSQDLASSNSRARFLHHDLLQQLTMYNYPGSRDFRLENIVDPVIESMLTRLSNPEVREVIIASMAVMLHPRLKAKLIEVAGRRNPDGTRKAQVTFFTNSRQAVQWLVPLPANYDYALTDMRDLLRAGVHLAGFFTADPRSRTNVGREDYPSYLAAHRDLTYLHEKVALIDDTIYIGSHNFNLPSSVHNDEATAEIQNATWAARLRRNFYLEMNYHSIPILLDDVENALENGGAGLAISRWLGDLLLALF
jgi:phosphatidylserine/phosphatidylglycerophosphate/cardiolipin synthase-like enzyme